MNCSGGRVLNPLALALALHWAPPLSVMGRLDYIPAPSLYAEISGKRIFLNVNISGNVDVSRLVGRLSPIELRF
jgi:hypothetical protein